MTATPTASKNSVDGRERCRRTGVPIREIAGVTCRHLNLDKRHCFA
ncbi:hypothetical protein ACIA98_22855 [Streptomyces sp. NPDC051366]